MSEQADPVDFSGHMLDLEEDEDLEVFTKVRIKPQTSQSQFNASRCWYVAAQFQPVNVF